MAGRTLVTGFGQFLSIKENPSSMLAQALDRPYHLLDVSYDAVEDFIFHLDPSSFDRLLLMGVAASRTHLTPELFARNIYGDAPDVRGVKRHGTIQQADHLLLESTLFGCESLSEVLLADPHMRLSLNAGNYLCNFAYFKALTAFPCKQVGFLHVLPFEKIALEVQINSILQVLDAVESQPIPFDSTPDIRAIA